MIKPLAPRTPDVPIVLTGRILKRTESAILFECAEVLENAEAAGRRWWLPTAQTTIEPPTETFDRVSIPAWLYEDKLKEEPEDPPGGSAGRSRRRTG